VNLAVICAATPTTSPGLGCTEATVGLGDVTAAKPGLADPTSTTTTNIVSGTSARLKVSKGTPTFTQAVDRAKPLLVPYLSHGDDKLPAMLDNH